MGRYPMTDHELSWYVMLLAEALLLLALIVGGVFVMSMVPV
jgi:hypothetical protein